ncbi:MAG TPA: hypothetical protein VH142_00785 [Polyangiaceae bacterium]|jgi:hypothetical protein|nr:hypothetical protein [Polyangiaceae bacterium]
MRHLTYPALALAILTTGLATSGATTALADEATTTVESPAVETQTAAPPETEPAPEPAANGVTVVHTKDVKADEASSSSGSPTTWRGEPFTLDAAFGYETADLTTFRSSLGAHSFTANIIPSSITGPSIDFGVGARLYALTFGLRGGVAFLGGDTQNPLQLYSVDAELGLRIPFDKVEAYLVLGGGYSVIGGLSDAIQGLSQGINVDGANLRLGLGVDYFFSKYFSVGVRATAEVLFLARHGVALRDLPNTVTSFDSAQSQLLSGSGSTVGTDLDFTVGPGLHF